MVEYRLSDLISARVVRQESTRSTEGESAPEELSPIAQMEEIFQRFMNLTGKMANTFTCFLSFGQYEQLRSAAG